MFSKYAQENGERVRVDVAHGYSVRYRYKVLFGFDEKVNFNHIYFPPIFPAVGSCARLPGCSVRLPGGRAAGFGCQ
jgi:hypothetical protein